MVSIRNFITWGGIALLILLLILLILNGVNSLELTERVTSSIDELATVSQINSEIDDLVHKQFTIIFLEGEDRKRKFSDISFNLLTKFDSLEKTATSSSELQILNSIQNVHDEFESLAGYLLSVEKDLLPDQRRKLLTELEAKVDFLMDSLAGLQSIEVQRGTQVTAKMREALLHRYYLFIMFLALLTLVAIIFFIFLHNLVMKPVKQLMISTRKVAKGDLEAKVQIKSKNEFGKLATSYNRMLHELKKNRQEIESKSEELASLNKTISIMNDELEQKVSSRTQSLQESRAYLNQIIYTAPVAFATFTQDGVATDLNSSFRRLTGLEKHKSSRFVSIEQLGELASPDFYSCWQKARGGQPSRTEPQRINVEGLEKWYVHNFSPQVDEQGELIRIICFSEDVSRQVQAHNRLVEKNKELESFVYSVSHDLKSPIFTIFGLLEMIKDDKGSSSSDKQVRLINNVEKKLSNMRQMISALLDLSRAGANKEKFTEFLLSELVRLSFLEEKVSRKEREATLEMGDLPEIFADRDLITQLFRNLISNSFKYSDPEKELKISFTSETKDGVHNFKYSDNGFGIAPEQRDKVFEVFYRCNPKEGEGAGVGLTIIHKIVESHGGEIWIEDSQESGATFRFTLPIQQ